MKSKLSVSTDSPATALLGPLRGFATPAAGWLKPWPSC